MRVLLIGSGGREHAIGWKLAQSARVQELISLPGNPGLADLGAVVEGIEPTDVGAVAAFAHAQRIDLVVVGPEAPLAAGLVDALSAFGVRAFGPSQVAAQLEASKAFAKRVMDRADVPTAAWAVFAEAAPAKEYLRTQSAPYVIKADGLAAGKGVLVTDHLDAADAWIDDCVAGRFGEGEVLIEAYLDGPEISLFAVCDGENAVLLEAARDYKRLSDGDLGPNTGGMGSYSPVPDMPPGLEAFTLDQVVRPVLRQMADDGHPYVGFLYVGLVLTDDGPMVLEFNCRLGDPETQVLMARLNSDLVDGLEAAVDGKVTDSEWTWSPSAAANVVLAADGYPESPQKGDTIKGLASVDDVIVFHAGTNRDDRGRLVVAGGRVLSIVGTGADPSEAVRKSYAAIEQIRWPRMQFRTDIAR